jgi:membrane-associated phospholipid phosphatase
MSEREGGTSVDQNPTPPEKAAQHETAPAPVRRLRAGLFQGAVLVAILVFAALTILVSATPTFPADVAITSAIQRLASPFFTAFMSAISWLGFPPQTFVITALLVLLIYAFGLHWEAVVAAVAAGGVSAVNVLVKIVVQRPRPTADLVQVFTVLNSYSFPSGHVMFYTAFFGFIWFLAYTVLKKSWKRTLLLIVFGGLVILVGISRVYLGEHWASDVLAAYLLGSLVLVAVIQFYRWSKPRFSSHQPVARERESDGAR